MGRIYVITWSDFAAVVVAESAHDIDRGRFPDCTVHEIGLAHPTTPPGCLLAAPSSELTRWRPLGREIPA